MNHLVGLYLLLEADQLLFSVVAFQRTITDEVLSERGENQ